MGAHGLLASNSTAIAGAGQEGGAGCAAGDGESRAMKQYSGWKRVIARAQLKFHLLKFEYAYVQQLSSTQSRDYIAGRTGEAREMRHLCAAC